MKVSKLAKLLDKIADRTGMGPEHIWQHPELLDGTILEPEDICQELVTEARVWHRFQMQKIQDRARGLGV